MRDAEMERLEDALLDTAREAAALAYAPYSGFHVGAAVLTDTGDVHSAANVENASYGLSLCAETNAVAAAVAAGARQITHVAVVGYRADAPTPTLATPCGRCRQVIAEFATNRTRVVVASFDGSEVLSLSLADLLPHAFGPNRMD